MRLRTAAAAVAIVAAGSLGACSSPDSGSGSGSGSTDGSNQQQDSGTNNGSSGSNSDNSGGSGDSDSSSGKSVTMDEAGDIATDKYGGTVKEVESDHYNGKAAWEVEIKNSDKGRIEVKVEKSTGKILDMEKD